MVLEVFLNPLKIENKPGQIIAYSLIYTILAILLGLWIFSSEASMVMVFLSVMALLPFVYSLLKKEENKDLIAETEKALLKKHAKVLNIFMLLFLGMTLAFSLSYVFLPSQELGTTFDAQISAINHNSGLASGNLFEKTTFFKKVLFNNLRVMVLALLFSFIYGSGAIFILAWNASVIGVAIGISIRNAIAEISSLVGLDLIAGYFNATVYGLTKYLIHGIPEILAYFAAGLAGGIISVSIVKHDFFSKKFNRILADSYSLIMISVLLIFLAALLEVWITPLLF